MEAFFELLAIKNQKGLTYYAKTSKYIYYYSKKHRKILFLNQFPIPRPILRTFPIVLLHKIHQDICWTVFSSL